MSTLVALALTLDTDPSCTTDGQNPPPCEHQLASVTIDLGEGTWDALREGCDSEGRCFRTVPYRERTATASPALVPEPAAVWLFGTGMLGFMGFARRRKVA
ncbi:MAG: PEP-CTERM sorting domain-containing protein [Gammaproteobacteria bacterium]